MLKYAIVFALISLVAGALGFTGVAAGAAGIAKVLFVLFLVLAVVFVVLAAIGVGAARKLLKEARHFVSRHITTSNRDPHGRYQHL